MITTAAITAGLIASAIAGRRARSALKSRGLDHCLGSLIRDSLRRRSASPVQLLLCIADHFEPQWGAPGQAAAATRVRSWTERYPSLFGGFTDTDGRPPRHSFFFPIDQYEPSHVDAIGDLCRAGFGELEIHLHHDRDTAENLRGMLNHFKSLLAHRHGLLSRRGDGALAYGFIHGNWALDNARPDGRWCGVSNELDVLRNTGCYADFTLPSAPSPTQTRIINSIYYAVDDPCRARSHDTGSRVGASPQPADSLMLIQGPLLLDWRRRKLENGCLQHSQPPTMARLKRWLDAHIHVPARPDWIFVKLHTHGAPEANQSVLLGESMVRFHQELAMCAKADPSFHYHYVTAREMYNLARAGEAGFTGAVRDALDYELVSNIGHGNARAAA